MRTQTLSLVIIAIATSLISLLTLLFVYNASHNFSALRAEYTVETADIGIPEITKMYDAQLVNKGKFQFGLRYVPMWMTQVDEATLLLSPCRSTTLRM